MRKTSDDSYGAKRVCTSLVIPFLIASGISCAVAVADTGKDLEDVLNVRDFGAKGDGQTDDTEALQAAINAALTLTGGQKPDVTYSRATYPGYPPIAVYLPRGTYAISDTIRIPVQTYSWNRALRITGEFARIKAVKEMDSCIHVDTASYLTIQGLAIDGNNLVKHGFTAFKISGRTALIERVGVGHALSHGFVLEKCQGAVFKACSSGENGGDGWHIMDCNACSFDACAGNRNKGNGFTVTAKDFSGGCVLRSFWSEGNNGHGVLITSEVSSQVILRDAWIEGNGMDGVNVGSVSAHLAGLGISGGFREGGADGEGRSKHASIRLTDKAAGCYVSGCQVRGGGLSGGKIRIEGDPAMHHVEGNFRMYRSRTVEPLGVDAVK